MPIVVIACEFEECSCRVTAVASKGPRKRKWSQWTVTAVEGRHLGHALRFENVKDAKTLAAPSPPPPATPVASTSRVRLPSSGPSQPASLQSSQTAPHQHPQPEVKTEGVDVQPPAVAAQPSPSAGFDISRTDQWAAEARKLYRDAVWVRFRPLRPVRFGVDKTHADSVGAANRERSQPWCY